MRIVLWIAVAEGLVAWATHGLHIGTIIVLAVVAFASLLLSGSRGEPARSSASARLAPGGLAARVGGAGRRRSILLGG